MKNVSVVQLVLILFTFVAVFAIIAKKYDVFEGVFSLNPLSLKFKAKRERLRDVIANAHSPLILRNK